MKKVILSTFLLLLIIPSIAFGASGSFVKPNEYQFKNIAGGLRSIILTSFSGTYQVKKADGTLGTLQTTSNYSSTMDVNVGETMILKPSVSAGSYSVDDSYFVVTVITPDNVPPVVTSSLATGTYTESQQVTLTANESATIYYTLDGSNPTTSSTVYNNPILIDKTTTLKYFGKDTAGNSSEVVSQTFTIEIPSDRDGDGVPDSSDLYPDDPTNTPPASDESSEAEKKTQSILIMIMGLALTAIVLGGKGIL